MSYAGIAGTTPTWTPTEAQDLNNGVNTISFGLSIAASSGTPVGETSFTCTADAQGPRASSDPITIYVKGQTATTAYAASGARGGTATLSGSLAYGGTAISGKILHFSVGGTEVGSATTGTDGKAAYDYTVPTAWTTGSSHAYTVAFTDTTDPAYNVASSSANIGVVQASTATAVAPASGVSGKTATLSATLTALGSGVAGKSVSFTLGGSPVGSGTTDATGVATCSCAVPSGVPGATYSVGAAFTADTDYLASSGSGTLTIAKYPTAIVTDGSIVASPGLNADIRATLQVDSSTPVEGRTLSFYWDGSLVGSAATDASGSCLYSYQVPSGTAIGSTHTMTVKFEDSGDSVYAVTSNTVSVKILKAVTIYIENVVGAPGKSIDLVGILIDRATGDRIQGYTLAFSVDGTPAGTAVTAANGYATRSFTVPAGWAYGSSHTVQVSYSNPSDAVYRSATRSAVALAVRHSTRLVAPCYADGRGLTITLYAYLDASPDATPLIGRSVAFSVDGNTVGTGTTDANGKAEISYTIPTAWAFGSAHVVNATFSAAGDTEYLSSAVNTTLLAGRTATKIVALAQTVSAEKSVKLSACLLTRTTGTRLKGQTLTFLVDGVSLGSAKTAANGYATISLDIPAGWAGTSHAVTIQYAGDTDYLATSSAAKLTVNP